jgi:hypothetical protein
MLGKQEIQTKFFMENRNEKRTIRRRGEFKMDFLREYTARCYQAELARNKIC